MNQAVIVFDDAYPPISFAASKLQESLANRGFATVYAPPNRASCGNRTDTHRADFVERSSSRSKYARHAVSFSGGLCYKNGEGKWFYAMPGDRS